jgi:predicted Zn-dependent peptidase
LEEYILENNLKLIYKHIDSDLTSICISIDAGAGVETEKYGIAHATEHMVYKGTKNRNEKEINEDLSNIFGFNNAMTNYPYVIYYGTLLGEDLKKGVELLSDIVLNPSFSDEGFKEEMDVIKEELKEWDEELEQYCEDKLFFNCFNNRRIKYPIIGTKESLESMTLNDIKEFYKRYYFPENTSIVVISSLKFEDVKNIITIYFSSWKNKLINSDVFNKIKDKLTSDNLIDSKLKNTLMKDVLENNLSFSDIEQKVMEHVLGHFNREMKLANEILKYRIIEYEIPKVKTFNDKIYGIKTCKFEIVCPIDNLNEKEMKVLRIFNQYFGDGINSILYDTLRTKNGLIYDVITKIAHENYIKLYKITFSTAKENVNKSIDLFKECIGKLEQYIDTKQIEQLIKNFKLKRLFREEQSIVLAKDLATYDTMFGDYKIYIDEVNNLDLLTNEMIFEVGNRVLKNLTIQIID